MSDISIGQCGQCGRVQYDCICHLPELTEHERQILDSMDMTPILGTLQERLEVATRAAINFMRQARDAEAENERLLAGKFTAVEIHNICHNLHGTVDLVDFARGCADEQRKLYGCAYDQDRAEMAINSVGDLNYKIAELEAVIAKLRQILAHVPGRIALKAKEDAGYGAEIRATEKRIDDRMEAQQAEYEMGLDADHERDDQ